MEIAHIYRALPSALPPWVYPGPVSVVKEIGAEEHDGDVRF